MLQSKWTSDYWWLLFLLQPLCICTFNLTHCLYTVRNASFPPLLCPAIQGIQGNKGLHNRACISFLKVCCSQSGLLITDDYYFCYSLSVYAHLTWRIACTLSEMLPFLPYYTRPYREFKAIKDCSEALDVYLVTALVRMMCYTSTTCVSK
jgi:hypothetical protein